ncbi:AAA family ATPase [Tenacibaculum retecalamus]|uniref:AAA family ATPase n=1 Tax=Tenacibaculum retecalamus TaxID=3018315 RepID=UPI0023D94566|nr:AAA family ATPase [Tenacibaculum retecalamus]WBX72013.1 AAA family ATPase [Tenacibaculum retecalamus]
MSEKKELDTYNLGNPDEFQEFLKKTSKDKKELSNVKKTELSLKELRKKSDKGEKIQSPIEATPPIIDKTNYSAFELYNFKTAKVPRLLDPFLQTVGLASLVGTSDSGKSTFLRQLSISIALKLDNFLGYKLNSKQNRVIYVSTEDDSTSLSYSIRKQVDTLKINNPDIDLSHLKNLDFIFDTTDLLTILSKKLKENPVDLVVIDAFTDVFTKEINANTQVRNFLNEYDKLAKKFNCLVIFLHHIGKRTQNNAPTKDSIIGSQAFEAKMRAVLELRPQGGHTSLWVLKSNFLESKYKKNGQILKLNKNLLFEHTETITNKQVGSKNGNPELIKKVIELKDKGFSYRKIELELKGTELAVSKSTAEKIFNNQKNDNSQSKPEFSKFKKF